MLASNVRLEQISYIISQNTLKKILIQVTRQTDNKQLSLCLLKEILKGDEVYCKFVEG